MPGKAAYGTTITGSVSGLVAAVTNISGPGLSLDTADVTAHDSAGAWEEVVATIIRSGEMSLDINFDPAAITHKALLARLIARTTEVWTIGGAMGVWSFAGYLVGFEPGAPHEDKLTASIRIKPTTTVTVPV